MKAAWNYTVDTLRKSAILLLAATGVGALMGALAGAFISAFKYFYGWMRW